MRKRLFSSLILQFVGCMVIFCGISTTGSLCAEDWEKLELSNGDTLHGRWTEIENGQLHWQISNGSEMLIPVEEVKSIHYPGPDLTPWWHPEDPVEVEPLIVAEDIPEPPPEPELTAWEERWDRIETMMEDTSEEFWDWTRRLEAGGQSQRGNGEQSSVTLRGKFEKSDEYHLMQIDTGGDYRTSEENVLINRWFIDSNVDYGKKTKWILYLKTQNRHDERKNLNYQGTLSAGMGYRFFNEGNKRLVVRLGPAVTHEIFSGHEPSNTTPDLYADMEMKWPLHDRIQFEMKSTFRPGLNPSDDGDVLRFNTEGSLLFQIDSEKHWYFKLGVLTDFNSSPGVGNSKSDFTSLFSIVYNKN